jgi:hypothetical protein
VISIGLRSNKGKLESVRSRRECARVQQVKPADLSARDDLNEFPSGEANGWACETHGSR